MAIPITVILGVLGKCSIIVLETPIIHRALEQYFAKTSTPIDNILWALLERVANIASPEPEVVAAAAKVQEVYDVAKAQGVLDDGAALRELMIAG